MEFPDRISYGEKYGPAMALTEQSDADAWFEACVEHCMRWGRTREDAERIERTNLGYWAGYYDGETRERVERLFRCEHPVFGKIAEKGSPTADQAMLAGMMAGVAARVRSERNKL